MFAGAVFSEEQIFLIVSLTLLVMAGCVLIGFMFGRWWVLLCGLLPLATGSRFLTSVVTGFVALGVVAAKLRGFWLRHRGNEDRDADRQFGTQPDRFDLSRR